MTTENLTGLDELRDMMTKRVDEAKARAKAVDDEAQAIRKQREKDIEQAQVILRMLEEDARHKLVPLEEEAEEMLRILEGDTAPADSASDVPPVEQPPAQPVVPVEPVAPAGPPTAPQPTVVRPAPAPEPIGNTSVLVAFVRWVRGWRILEWVLALLLAFIAYKVSGDHQSFGFRTGFWAHAQHFFWRSGWTFIGFSVGGFIGTWLRPRIDIIVAESRRAHT